MANRFSVFTYTPDDVILIIAGYQVLGWDTIQIPQNSDNFVPIPGIRGKNTRSQNIDTSATLTVSIMQTSQSNDVLSRIHALDIQNGTGRLEVTLRDKSGNSIFSSDDAYIVGYPTPSFSATIEYRNWTIQCQTTSDYQVNGNGKANFSLFDSSNILNIF